MNRPDLDLTALPACAIDLETTGLDVAKDRVVSAGGVGLIGVEGDDNPPFDRLVNPGIAIPRRSSVIHGITDNMVSDAATIGEVLPTLDAYIGGRVVIGHHIGFDLAILKNEAARVGRADWRTPRFLDIAHLATGLRRGWHDLALEAMAERFNVTITGRHTALGDARAAAAIWREMIPMLQLKGIATLAQAEAMAASARGLIRQQRRYGWVVPGG